MPLAPGQSDRRLLLSAAAVVLVLATALVLLSPDKDDEATFASTFSAKSHGAKAAFLLLQESGYKVERWAESPTQLPDKPAGTVLILAQPVMPLESGERAALASYLMKGGRILAIGRGAAPFLPRAAVAQVVNAQVEWKQVQPRLPSRITRGGPITTPVFFTLKPEMPDTFVHYATDDGPVVISYRHGAGEVIWWIDDTPITNAGISEKGNLELLLNSIGDRNTLILWDEFFHEPRKSLWARVSDTPLSWMLLQAGLVGMALILTYSRRSGPVHPLIEASRLLPLEFVETLGALYKRARASGFAVEVAYGRFRHLLTRRLGLQRDLDSDALARAARERFGYKDDNFADTLRDCSAAVHDPDLGDARAVELLQKLNEHARELQLTATRAQEKR